MHNAMRAMQLPHAFVLHADWDLKNAELSYRPARPHACVQNDFQYSKLLLNKKFSHVNWLTLAAQVAMHELSLNG